MKKSKQMEFDIMKTEGTGGTPEQLYTKNIASSKIVGKVILFDDKSLPLELPVKPANGVRYLPKQEPRVETGNVQFGDDWRGLFLRGDYCADLLVKLSKLLNKDITPIEKELIYEFHEMLKHTRE